MGKGRAIYPIKHSGLSTGKRKQKVAAVAHNFKDSGIQGMNEAGIVAVKKIATNYHEFSLMTVW
jgi:hypothetical protein